MSTLTAPARLAGPARSELRLTRRGRLVLSVLTLLALLTALTLLAGPATGGATAMASLPGFGGDGPAATHRITVRPGETLWEIALRTAPGVDPRETVEEILRLNALDSAAVPAGSVLLLPAG